MKNEQKLHAKNLFLDTNLTQTEIAAKVGVNRRTIRLWSQEHNWENLRRSSRHLPSMVAEKCYYLIDQFTTHLLSANNVISTFSSKDADAINKMASAIKKLKARSAINESMEMFNFFIEDVKRKDEKMAEAISPFIEDYFTNRANISIADFQLSEFDETGRRAWQHEEKEIKERWEDEKENEAIQEALMEAQISEREASEPKLTAEEVATIERIEGYKQMALPPEFRRFMPISAGPNAPRAKPLITTAHRPQPKPTHPAVTLTNSTAPAAAATTVRTTPPAITQHPKAAPIHPRHFSRTNPIAHDTDLPNLPGTPTNTSPFSGPDEPGALVLA